MEKGDIALIFEEASCDTQLCSSSGLCSNDGSSVAFHDMLVERESLSDVYEFCVYELWQFFSKLHPCMIFQSRTLTRCCTLSVTGSTDLRCSYLSEHISPMGVRMTVWLRNTTLGGLDCTLKVRVI